MVSTSNDLMHCNQFDAYCMCSPVVEVGTDQTSYTVAEEVGQLEVWISITSGRKAPGQECEIAVATVDGSAIG